MKTAKRILAVILLAVIIWAVGYLVFTGRRLPSVFTEGGTEEQTTIEITESYEGSVTNGEKETETTTETTETTCGS